jgi:hypothetical protein
VRFVRVVRSTLPRAAAFGILVALSMTATSARAQRMDLALSRLSVPSDPMSATCPTERIGPDGRPYPQEVCQDDDSWRQLATQFTGALIPPLLTPARTRGPRSFYFGLDTSITGIDANRAYWHRGTEGTGSGSTGIAGENRQVDGVLAWTRLTVRKALPFGFELGTNIGYLVNTSYWALGVEIRWALLEGWLTRDWWVPDIAVRGAVQTLVGDAEFNATVATVDLTISNSIVIGDQFELTPILAGQIAWAFADTELVDLTPSTSAFSTCNPDPTTPTGPTSLCRASGMDYNHNAVFPSIRTMRPRVVFGLQGRYEAFTLTGSFSFDAVPPHETDSSLVRYGAPLPDGTRGPRLPDAEQSQRQWRLDIGVGLSY